MAHGPGITTVSPLVTAEVGFPYLAFISGTGGAQPYNFSIVSGALASGLNLSSSGVISGTPLSAQVDSIGVQITDASGGKSSIVVLSLTVIPGVAITTTSPLPGGTQGTAYSTTIAATGGATPYLWSIVSQTGTNAFAINASTGVLTSTAAHAETDSIVIQALDALGYAFQRTFAVTLAANAPSITTSSPLTSGIQGTAYSTALNATAGVPPYTWSILSQSGPNVYSISGSNLVGTPANAETDTLSIQVLDSASTPASKSFSLTIIPSGGAGVVLFLFPQTMPDMNVGVPVAFTIPFVGGTGTYPTCSGSGLPPGLTFTSDGNNNGLLQGTPTSAGTFSATLNVVDSASNPGTEVFTCNVF